MHSLRKILINRSWIETHITALILIGTILFGPFNRTSNAEVLTITDFSCDGMTGFTFKYPIFKGCEPSLARKITATNNICNIFLNHPKEIQFRRPSQIIIIKRTYAEDHDFEIPADAVSKSPNPNGIPYIYRDDAKSGNFVTFYAKDFKVYVEVQSVSENLGFSKDIFFKMVIESFQIQDSPSKN